MRYLRQNTATIVTVGPFYDKTTGVDIEGSLTITNERITLVVDANDGGAPTLVLDNVTGATSGTDNDLNYITNCDAGLMQLELSAANTNYVGRAMLTITDAANHVPVFHEFTILPGAVYDSLIAGTDKLAVDAQEISSDSTAADNLEAACDGTGYNVGNGSVVAASVTAEVSANVTKVSGDATAADNLEAAADGTGYNLGGGQVVAASVTGAVGSVTGAVGSVTGAVGSVTGAVGSVTGNVGGNVAGSVASVTGAVGSVTGAVGSVTAMVSANVTQISGDSTAADNLEAFCDGTGYAGTNNVIPTVTTVGTTTNLTNLPAAAATAAELAKVPKSDSTVSWNATALAAINAQCDTAISDAALATAAALATVDGIVDDILVDTGTTLPAAIADVPTVAEFEARSIAAATYATAADLATVDGIVDSILEDTAVIGAAGAGLTALPWNAAWDAEVQSEAADALTAYDPPTNAEMEARTLAAAAYFDPAADVVAHVTLVDTTTTNTDMVAAAPSAATVADAVWDEAIAGHAGAGSTGAALASASSAGDPWSTALPGAYGAGTAGKIVGDNLDAAISSRLATAGYTAPDNASIAAVLEDTGTTLPAAIADVPTVAEFEARTLVAADYTVVSDLPAAAPTAADVRAEMDANSTKLANLDAAVSSRAAATTALSNVTWTDARAAKVDNLDAAVSTRSTYAGGAVASVTGNVGGNVVGSVGSVAGAVASVTGAVGSVTAAVSVNGIDAATANKVADHTLRRAAATAEASADGDALDFRSLMGAVAKQVNKVAIAGSTLTVYETDDETELGTQTLTSDADAEPITGADTD